MRLTTKRLILRDPTIKDAKDIAEHINNLKISRYLLTVPHPYTLGDAKWWINHCDENIKKKPRTSYEFNIALKPENRIIGGAGLHHIDLIQGTSEIGYWLAEPYWRKGYMTEATSRLIDFAFKKLELERLQGGIFASNKPSQGLAKSLGFKQEGKGKIITCMATGKRHREVPHVLYKHDWMKKR